MFSVTKSYRDLPAAHTQHNHGGHCRFIHGHNWGFDVTFECDVLDHCGFVVDVGRLQSIKDFLTELLDHTLLVNEDDPRRKVFVKMMEDRLADVRFVPNCGMEGLAKFVWEKCAVLAQNLALDERGLRVVSVVCWEDGKNFACYSPPKVVVSTGE